MSDKKLPLVSVIITNYNYAQYVGEAIESVLNQTYKNLEIIIIDDGSTDDSDKVISVYVKKNKNIRYIKQKNQGVVYTRNKAIDLAQGEFLCFLDADDYFDKEYVEKTVTCAIKNKSDVVYTNFKMFGTGTETSNFHEYSLEELKNGNFIHISSLIRKSALSGVRFDDELAGETHEDWDLFLSLGVNGAIMTLCREVFLNYRIHDNSRNNMMKSDDERRKYASVYSYIIRKHINANQPGFDYLVGLMFADWYNEISSEKLRVEEQKRAIENELNAIKSSRKYKALMKIAKFKNILRMKRN